MSDNQLLKQIEALINPLLKSQKELEKVVSPMANTHQEILEEMSSVNTHLVYLESAYKSLAHQYDALNAAQKHIEENLKSFQKEFNTAAKTLDIVSRRYDERIVQNAKDIDEIKKHLSLPS